MTPTGYGNAADDLDAAMEPAPGERDDPVGDQPAAGRLRQAAMEPAPGERDDDR